MRKVCGNYYEKKFFLLRIWTSENRIYGSLKGKPVPSTWPNNVNSIIHAIETIRPYEEVISEPTECVLIFIAS